MIKSILIELVIFAIIVVTLFTYSCSGQGPVDSISSGATSNTMISGDTNSSKELNTRVIVNKTLDGTRGYPNLIYKIKTPKIDYFDFVLALDSSGSFSYGQDKSEAHAVVGAVPLFIKDIINNKNYNNKAINLSIISFDDNIDFAYAGSAKIDPFKNNEVRLSMPMNVTKVDMDLENHDDVFGENTKDFDYYANEAEFTNLSVPIAASIDILDSVKQDRLHRISKFMILVTGKSEFSNCTEELLQLAISKNYSIYVIGMDLINDDSDAIKMKSQLMKISEFDKLGWYRLQYVPLGATPDELKKNLFNALQKSLENAINSPAARNVTIVESFYPYIRPEVGSIEVNGTIGAIENLDYNEDTNSLSFKLKQGLFPESETTVVIPLKMHLSGLPISITSSSVPFSTGPIDKNNPISTVKYIWFDGYLGNLSLTENKMDLNIDSQKPNNPLDNATHINERLSINFIDSLKGFIGA